MNSLRDQARATLASTQAWILRRGWLEAGAAAALFSLANLNIIRCVRQYFLWYDGYTTAGHLAGSPPQHLALSGNLASVRNGLYKLFRALQEKKVSLALR